MRRFLLNLVVLFGLISLVSAGPVQAARIFRADQQTLLKGVDPRVASSGSCSFPTTNLLARFKASDLANLYTDIAGTTNVASDGDLVGKWVDANGSGFYVAAAADDTTRGTYRANAGFPYVEFDGVNDLLKRASALGLYTAGSSTVMVALRDNATQQGTLVQESLSTSTNDRYELIRNNGTVFNDATAFIRDHSNTVKFSTTVILSGAFPGASTDAVYTITDSGTSLTGYLDGGSGSSQTYSRGASSFDQFSLGGRYDATAFAKVKVYEIAFWSGVISSPDKASAITCMGLSQNRTL